YSYTLRQAQCKLRQAQYKYFVRPVLSLVLSAACPELCRRVEGRSRSAQYKLRPDFAPINRDFALVN
ncbi:MAG: hypothetical protein ACE5NP_09755, partial [Anaerolineae bacterium]